MRKLIALAAVAGAAALSSAAQAETIFFQTFTDGLTASESLGGSFKAESGRVGHTSGVYGNFDYSYYQVALDLTHFTDALLTFDYDLVSEQFYDGFNVAASTTSAFDPSKVIRSLANEFYQPMTNNLSHLGRTAVTGSRQGTTQFDLSQFAGGTVNLRFQFQSDYSAFARGLLLDNVIVTGTPAVSAAPEPAAWALMILGFGAAGSMLRRRRLAAA